MTRVESSHLIKNVTRVESSQETAERDSSRVRVTKNRDSSRVESLTRVTTSLVHRHAFPHCFMLLFLCLFHLTLI